MVIGIVAIGLFAIFGSYALLHQTPPKPKDRWFGAPVQIGRDIYKFPRNAQVYLPDEGGRPQCVSLRIVFPEMEGLTPKNSVEMDGLTLDSGALQLLLCDRAHPDLPLTAHWTPDQSTGRVAANRLVDNPEKSAAEALLDYEQREMFDGTELVLKSSAPRTDYRRTQLDQGDRIIADLENGKFLTFVECVNANQYKNPGCNMQFGFRDVSVSVYFKLSHLANWQEIREKSKVFFEAHRLKNIST
jgi:hypothetical protein